MFAAIASFGKRNFLTLNPYLAMSLGLASKDSTCALNWGKLMPSSSNFLL